MSPAHFVPVGIRYAKAQFIGFKTPYDVAPRHFEVIFTFTSREDVLRGYTCRTRPPAINSVKQDYTLQPQPLRPSEHSGIPRTSTCSVFDGDTPPNRLREPTPVQPKFNTPYTMRWCLSATACARGTETYKGNSKAEGMLSNEAMSVYTPDSPFLAEFSGTLRAIVVADNYQNSAPVDLPIVIQEVAPVRIYPSGDQLSATAMKNYVRKSDWITKTDEIFLWTPTPNTAIYYTETTGAAHASPATTKTEPTCQGTANQVDASCSGVAEASCTGSNDGTGKPCQLSFTKNGCKTQPGAAGYNCVYKKKNETSCSSNFIKAGGKTSAHCTSGAGRGCTFKPSYVPSCSQFGADWAKMKCDSDWKPSTCPDRAQCPAGCKYSEIWTKFSTCSGDQTCLTNSVGPTFGVETRNFTRTYSIDLFATGVKTGLTDAVVTREWFEVQVAKPVAWPAYETSNEWTQTTKTSPVSSTPETGCANVASAPSSTTPESLRASKLSAGTAGVELRNRAGVLEQTKSIAGFPGVPGNTPTRGKHTATQNFCCDRVFGVMDGNLSSSTWDQGESYSNCLDRYYKDSVQVFFASETLMEPAGESQGDCPDAHKLSVDTTLCTPNPQNPAQYCPPGSSCPLREKTIEYRIGGNQETSTFTTYTDKTAPRLWESNRLAVKANKGGLKESDVLTVYYRIKLEMPQIIDDPDQIDISTEVERRDKGTKIQLDTLVTVNAKTGTTGGGDTSKCMGLKREQCTTGSRKHATLYYSMSHVNDLACDCRQGVGFTNGYGLRPTSLTASCKWKVYDDTNRPTLLDSANFCTQIVAEDGTSVNSDVAYRLFYVKSPTVQFVQSNQPIYTSDMTVNLKTETTEPGETCVATDKDVCAAISGAGATKAACESAGACQWSTVTSTCMASSLTVCPSAITMDPCASVLKQGTSDQVTCKAAADCSYTPADPTNGIKEACTATSPFNPLTNRDYWARKTQCTQAGKCTYTAPRKIWYVLANPGSDWWTTSEPPVRQSPKACPHWACGSACPQKQDQCPAAEDKSKLLDMKPSLANSGLGPTDTRKAWSTGPVTYFDLIESGKYIQMSGSLDATLRNSKNIEVYDPAKGIKLSESKVVISFSTQDNKAVSNLAVQDFDVRVDDVKFSFTKSAGAIPADVSTSPKNPEGVSALNITATTSTSGSRVHICRKKRCPKALQEYIDNTMKNIHKDCSSCDNCDPIKNLKVQASSHAEFQGAALTGPAPYSQGAVYNHFLESGCNMYFFQKYPEAATMYASCEKGQRTPPSTKWVPKDIAALGSYWFTTDVLKCKWDLPTAGSAPAFNVATWDSATSTKSTTLSFNSAVLAFGTKRNLRPSFFRGLAPRSNAFQLDTARSGCLNGASPTCINRTESTAKAGIPSQINDWSTGVDDWASSYTEYFVKVKGVEISHRTCKKTCTPKINAVPASCKYQCTADTPGLGNGKPEYDVTLKSSTPDSKIHYKFFPNYPRENTLLAAKTGNCKGAVSTAISLSSDCLNGKCSNSTHKTQAACVADKATWNPPTCSVSTHRQNCYRKCVIAATTNSKVRFCQHAISGSATLSTLLGSCSYASTCTINATVTSSQVREVHAATMRHSLPTAVGRKDPIAGFSVTDAAPSTYGCGLGEQCGYAQSPMTASSTAAARKFTADSLTTTDLTLPNSGWYTAPDGFDRFTSTGNLNGNTWSHCDHTKGDIDPTDGKNHGKTPPVKLENIAGATGSTGSTCTLRLRQSGRLFAFATRVGVDVNNVADVDTGGLQVPSDVSWADYEIVQPTIEYETFSTACSTTGSIDYCSQPRDSKGRARTAIIGKGYVYLCAGTPLRGQSPPLNSGQMNSNGAVVCEQDKDTRIHYTRADGYIVSSPSSQCEANMETVQYDQPPTNGWVCPNQNGKPLWAKTMIWQGSITHPYYQNNAVLLQATSSSRFFQIKAKAVKKFAGDSPMLTLTYTVAVDLCAQTSCDIKVRLGQTSASSAATFVTPAVAGATNPTTESNDAIKKLNTNFLPSIKTTASGQAWYTDPLSVIQGANANIKGIGTMDTFVVDITLDLKMPILQMTMGWSDQLLSEAPQGCAVFSISGRMYDRATTSMKSNMEVLKVKGGNVETCVMPGPPLAKGTKACDNTGTKGTLWSTQQCATTPCPIDVKPTANVNPYRSSTDLFQLTDGKGEWPVMDSLRFSCKKMDGADGLKRNYSPREQKLQLGSWILYGVKMSKRNDPTPAGTCPLNHVKSCDQSKCVKKIILGDGVCDPDFNCKAYDYDDLDCLAACEETADAQGTTCGTLVQQGVSCNAAIASGYDCSCTC